VIEPEVGVEVGLAELRRLSIEYGCIQCSLVDELGFLIAIQLIFDTCTFLKSQQCKILLFNNCETETLNCEIKKKECAFLKPLITLMHDFLLPNALKSDVKKGK